MAKCEEDSDDIPHIPLILFLSIISLLACICILYLLKKKLSNKPNTSNAITQCNLIKMQQITIHPDESIHMIQQAL